jgi:DNA-binding Xre family transcriptional regulator
MLTLNLAPIFKTRGIERPHAFLVKAGIHSSIASKILSTGTRVFRLDHIELLCSILVCEPNDLLSRTPDRGEMHPPSHPPSHPLQNHRHDDAISN